MMSDEWDIRWEALLGLGAWARILQFNVQIVDRGRVLDAKD